MMPNIKDSSVKRPEFVNLGNWREFPNSKWSFQHVRELMPTSVIKCAENIAKPLNKNLQDVMGMVCDSPEGRCSFAQLLRQGDSDGLVILHQGDLVAEWGAQKFNSSNPHILFSVSKSITAMLAGILQHRGLIDSEAPVIEYLPLTIGSVYADCTIRDLLDMTVALDFEENYTDAHSEYMQYRVATGWNPVVQCGHDDGLEPFLYSLKKAKSEHGHAFLYRSPNTDLLGLLLERAADAPLADLLSCNLWQPMGATSDAYITLDRNGLGRAAGGICATVYDLARLGQLFLDNGQGNGKQVLPPTWIDDTCNNGDQRAWDRGNYKHKLPQGKYRNQWYQTGDEDRAICARGIHGQLLYVNPARSVVIAKVACQREPLNDVLAARMLQAFDKISRIL